AEDNDTTSVSLDAHVAPVIGAPLSSSAWSVLVSPTTRLSALGDTTLAEAGGAGTRNDTALLHTPPRCSLTTPLTAFVGTVTKTCVSLQEVTSARVLPRRTDPLL